MFTHYESKTKDGRVVYLERIVLGFVAGTSWIFGVVGDVRQCGTTAIDEDVFPARVAMIITEYL